MNSISELCPGTLLGRYEILVPIGQGGMAAVWAARQRGSRGFSKIVAIKTMLPTISDDPRFERMFLDEATIASKIRHDHVVEILDLGEQNAVLYLVMEWIDGDSLSAIRRAATSHGGIPVAIAVRIIADACAGLHAAHELCDDEGQSFGLVHRDVSPQNILVATNGGVKVLDFGVAKVAGRISDTTNVGHARGKPPYMAPEQALGRPIDRRADIFSLGIVLYQLIADRHPFRGENDIATLHNIVSDTKVLSPRTFLPDLSEGLERLMLKALERDPSRRFQTAQEMEFELEALLDAELGRVRQEEIGRIVGSWLGSRGEERRQAVREAIRRADAQDTSSTDDGETLRGVRLTGGGDGNRLVGATGEVSALTTRHPARNALRQEAATAECTTSTATGSDAQGVPLLARDADLDERTMTELRPSWERIDGAYEDRENGAAESSRRKSMKGRTAAVVLAAMLVGAVVTWVAQRFQSRARSEETAHSTATGAVVQSPGHDAATLVVTTNPVPEATTVAARASAIDAGPVTALPESRSVNESKSSNGRNRRRVDGPSYSLPPISSPGF